MDPPFLGLTAATLVALLSGCDTRKPNTETASATVTDTAAGSWEKNKDAVPITSGSDAARQLYLQGRAPPSSWVTEGLGELCCRPESVGRYLGEGSLDHALHR